MALPKALSSSLSLLSIKLRLTSQIQVRVGRERWHMFVVSGTSQAGKCNSATSKVWKAVRGNTLPRESLPKPTEFFGSLLSTDVKQAWFLVPWPIEDWP